jgi:hypothetical protein
MIDEPDELRGPLLRRAATFFSEHPDFLGYWLAKYRESAGTEPPAQARLLGCNVEALQQLAVCLCPREESLLADTAELSQRFGVDQDRLADMLLHAKAYEAGRLRRAAAREAQAGSGWLPALAAASDREEGTGGAIDGDEPEEPDGR